MITECLCIKHTISINGPTIGVFTMSTTTIVQEARADVELHPLEHEAVNNTPVQDDSVLTLNRGNALKLVAAGFSFFFAGTNDASLGALTPYVLRTYGVGTEYVALM
jgi:hypothetical protein